MTATRNQATFYIHNGAHTEGYKDSCFVSCEFFTLWFEVRSCERLARITIVGDGEHTKGSTCLWTDSRTVIDLLLGHAPIGIVIDAAIEVEDRSWLTHPHREKPADQEDIGVFINALQYLATCDIVEAH